ncbi:MAG: hypothetical protein NTX79_01490 [Candidatus Micrarchaeota archaeon]|nr:hypothetical protein [Candidatus Micrarchaeota archaeon]
MFIFQVKITKAEGLLTDVSNLYQKSDYQGVIAKATEFLKSGNLGSLPDASSKANVFYYLGWSLNNSGGDGSSYLKIRDRINQGGKEPNEKEITSLLEGTYKESGQIQVSYKLSMDQVKSALKNNQNSDVVLTLPVDPSSKNVVVTIGKDDPILLKLGASVLENKEEFCREIKEVWTAILELPELKGGKNVLISLPVQDPKKDYPVGEPLWNAIYEVQGKMGADNPNYRDAGLSKDYPYMLNIVKK